MNTENSHTANLSPIISPIDHLDLTIVVTLCIQCTWWALMIAMKGKKSACGPHELQTSLNWCLLQWVDLPCENMVLIPSIRWWLFASRIMKNQLVQHILVISSINCSLASQWIQNSLRNRSCTFSYCRMFTVLVDRNCTGRVHCMKACM